MKDLGNIKKEALKYYNYALKLDPNHEETLINKAELLLLDDNKKDAFIYIEINSILFIRKALTN